MFLSPQVVSPQGAAIVCQVDPYIDNIVAGDWMKSTQEQLYDVHFPGVLSAQFLLSLDNF